MLNLNQNNCRVITLWQPWASFIQQGIKKIETRDWSLPDLENYKNGKNKLLIHAAKKPINQEGKWLVETVTHKPFEQNDYPLGVIVAIFIVEDCLMMTDYYYHSKEIEHLPHLELTVGYMEIPQTSLKRRMLYINSVSETEQLVGHYAPGRFAWISKGIIPLNPVQAVGHQKLWVPSLKTLNSLSIKEQ